MAADRRMVAIVIGVRDAPGLDYLGGAVVGARDFFNWAQALGYEATLITDEPDAETLKDNPVTIPRLRSAMEAVLTPGKPVIDRFVLYFAGHGLIREAEEGLWLLSEWKSELRAVAVEGLKRRLYRYGVKQIAIFADACRSLPTDIDTADLAPDPVLGSGPVRPLAAPSIDKFVAAQDGARSYMVPGPTPEQDRCIFSGVLLEALWGTQQAAFSKYMTHKITSRSLGAFLQSEVPAVAKRYGRILMPNVSPTFAEGEDIYFGDEPCPTAPVFPPWPTPETLLSRGPGAPSQMSAPVSTAAPQPPAPSRPPAPAPQPPAPPRPAAPAPQPPAPPRPPGPAPQRPAPSPARAPQPLPPAASPSSAPHAPAPTPPFASSTPPTHSAELPAPSAAAPSVPPAPKPSRSRPREELEAQLRAARIPGALRTGCGLVVTGIPAAALWIPRSACAQLAGEHGEWQIGQDNRDGENDTVRPDTLTRPTPVLVELANGLFSATVALPGFVASIVSHAQGVSALVYHKLGGPSHTAAMAGQAIVCMARSMLRAGEAGSLAAQVRQDNYADPILGVISAYLYDSAGNINSIRNLAYSYCERGQAIPYDIALLGQLPGERCGELLCARVPEVTKRVARTEVEKHFEPAHIATPAAEGVVGGLWPLMRQGWTFLEHPAEDGSTLVLPGLIESIPRLKSSRFATLDPEGGACLAERFQLKRWSLSEAAR